MLELPLLLKTAATFLLGMFAGFYFRWEKLTIREYERGLLFKNGLYKRDLLPGRYNIGWNAKVTIVDMRQENYLVSQTILTSDNIHIGINITVRTKVKDAYKAIMSSQNFQQDTHDITRSVIKAVGRKTKTKTILTDDDKYEARIFETLATRLDKIGMQVIDVELIDAKIPHSIQEDIADPLDDLVKKKETRKKTKVGF